MYIIHTPYTHWIIYTPHTPTEYPTCTIIHTPHTHHRIPHNVSEGDKWMKRDVILSRECGTTELVQSTIALRTGPFENPKMIGKRSPRMESPRGSQR